MPDGNTAGHRGIGYTVAGGGLLLFFVGLSNGAWAPALGGVTLILVSVVYIAVGIVCQRLIANDAGTRAQLAAIHEAETRLATQRAEFAADANAWKRDRTQEELSAQQRLAGLLHMLEETRAELESERAKRGAVEEELQELQTDHNTLIQETMQAHADLFAKGRGRSTDLDVTRFAIPRPASDGSRARPRGR